MRVLTSSLIVEAKKKKKKGKFTWKGKSYDTNPFAVCNKNISKKEEPDKWERCVEHVMDSSKK